MGYQNVEVISGWSLFTATFKNLNAEQIDLKTLVPTTPLGATITGDNKVKVYVLDGSGDYGDAVEWYGTLGGWSKDGVQIIDSKEVTVGNGVGIAIYNNLKVANGIESTAKSAKASSAIINVSGEVDLVCANTVISGWSVNGNSTPVPVKISKIVPTTPAGATITGDGKIKLYQLDSKGDYGNAIVWLGTQNTWEFGDGTSTTLEPGKGFAIYNSLKVANGVESTAKSAKASPAVLKLPSPISTPAAE